MEQEQDGDLYNSAGSTSLDMNQLKALHDENVFLRNILDIVKLMSKNHSEDEHSTNSKSSSRWSSPIVATLLRIIDCMKSKLFLSWISFGTVADLSYSTNFNNYDGIRRETEETNDNGYAMDQALAIDLILDEILGHLPASDLKTCRAVSHKWNSNTTKIILKKQLFPISLHVVDSTTRLVQQFRKNPVKESTANLRELSELITNPKIDESRKSSANQTYSQWLFPSNHFAFLTNNLSNGAIREFIENCGHIIKNLQLQVDDDDDNPEHVDEEFRRLADLKKMLTRQLPNLEKLTLMHFPLTWYDPDDLGQLFPEPRSLALTGLNNGAILGKLKTLELFTPPPTKFLLDIVASAPSLSNIIMNRSCDLEHLEKLAERNKIHLVTDIRLGIYPEDLELCENFLKTHGNKLCLKTLSICLKDSGNIDYSYWDRGFQVIAKFLRCCSQSLVELHTDRFGSWPGFDIPILPRLKVLRVTSVTAEINDTYDHYLCALFPTGVKLSKIFPAIETFHLTMLYDASWKEKIGASRNDKLLTVKCVFLLGVPGKFVVNFCKMFPNTKVAYVETLGDFRVTARALWTLKKLEDLTFGSEFILGGNNMHPALDAGFTGFSDETCLELYNSSRDVEISSVNALRENTSILDAKNLRKLDIFFLDFGTEYGGSTYPLISHVTGIFAFKMCPQLAVRCSYDAHVSTFKLKWLKMAISPILPYVTEFGKALCRFG